MSDIICPNCDIDVLEHAQNQADWLYCNDLYQEVTKDVRCPICLKEFVVEAFLTYRYDTYKKPITNHDM